MFGNEATFQDSPFAVHFPPSVLNNIYLENISWKRGTELKKNIPSSWPGFDRRGTRSEKESGGGTAEVEGGGTSGDGASGNRFVPW